MSINSGKHAGSETASKAAMLSGSSQLKPLLFLDQLEVDVTSTIVVMIRRVWDVNAVNGCYLSKDFVVSDSKGNMIHCSAKSSVAHNFLILKEGARKVSGDPYGFRIYPFRLIEFDQVEPANNKYLIDIAGYVTNVRRTSYTKSGSKTLEFYLANQRLVLLTAYISFVLQSWDGYDFCLMKQGQSLGVTLWGELGDVLVEKKTKHAGVCAMVLTGMSGKDRATPSKAPLPIDFSQPREGTLENLLIWARNLQNNTTTFHCKVMIETFRTKKGRNYPSCGYEKYRKGATRKLGKWVCEACNRAVNYPVFRYMLKVVAADDTTHTVVVMFNDTAMELLKNLIGTTHVLEIKSHTYYEYGTFESFNCLKINPNTSAEDDASSSTPAVTANDAEPSMKIATKPPTVCTPLKPNEEKKQKRHDLEDSGVDEVSDPPKNKEKSNVDVAMDTQKKRKRPAPNQHFII
ncbi:replication protein A 70 kDa DNA-binding subunit C-like protein, partial [Tanacetum coccineum]